MYRQVTCNKTSLQLAVVRISTCDFCTYVVKVQLQNTSYTLSRVSLNMT